MCGIGTVLADDPTLTCRIENPSNPIRIVCDTHLQIPIDSKIVHTAKEVPTYIAASCIDERKAAALEKFGVKILEVPEQDGHVKLRSLMRRLGNLEIDSVLLEGGSALHEAAFRAGIVQHMQVYIAPKIFGGVSAKPAVGGIGVMHVEEAYKLSTPEIRQYGNDVLLDYDILEG